MLNTILPDNFVLTCDIYKDGHPEQYPKDTELLYVVCVPRKPSKYSDKITAMGQSYLAHYLSNVRVTNELLDEAAEEINGMGVEFNRSLWQPIVDEYNGILPLAMMGVEEGRVVDPQTPIVAFIATDKRFGWLASRVETIAQSCIWKMSTVASLCRAMRLKLETALEICGENTALAEYMLHNFGDRAAADPEEAVRSAIAHGLYFSGSDCTNANRYIKKIYNTNKSYFSSVVATEHSVMCSWSDPIAKDDFKAAEMAVDLLDAAVERSKRGIGIPLVSVVIDTYNPYRFTSEYIGSRLKNRVINSGGKLVLRPDSGDPLIEPVKIIKLLDEAFGTVHNTKGFLILPPYAGIIQGDGINETSVPIICDNIIKEGYSVANAVFGMGHGMTHRGGRDDFSFSMKSTARFDGKAWHDLLKEPITDAGKKSLTGLVRCVGIDGDLEVVLAKNVKDLFYNTSGWHVWLLNGTRPYTQDYETSRAWARGVFTETSDDSIWLERARIAKALDYTALNT